MECICGVYCYIVGVFILDIVIGDDKSYDNLFYLVSCFVYLKCM